MDAHRHRRVLVVGEHLLPVRLLRELGNLGCRLERQCQLAVSTRDRLAARGDTEPPQQLAPRPPVVARACRDERLERVDMHGRPSSKVAEVGIGLSCLDGLRVRLADRLHIADPDPDRAILDRAFRPRAVDVRRPHLHPAPLCVAHQRRRRVEAHWLRVQQCAEELAGVVATQPRATGRRAARTQRRVTSGSRSRRSRRACRRSRARSPRSSLSPALPRRSADATPRSPLRCACGSSRGATLPPRRSRSLPLPSRRRAPDPGRRRRRACRAAAHAATRARRAARTWDPGGACRRCSM